MGKRDECFIPNPVFHSEFPKVTFLNKSPGPFEPTSPKTSQRRRASVRPLMAGRDDQIFNDVFLFARRFYICRRKRRNRNPAKDFVESQQRIILRVPP